MNAALVVASLLLCMAPLRSRNACGSKEFRCSEGTCVPLRDKCNAVRNCPDGSDEDPIRCYSPSTSLVEGDVVHVHAECKPEHIDVSFVLCQDATECNRLAVVKDPSDGEQLQYNYHTGCNEQGFVEGCKTMVHQPARYKECSGTMDLVVERRAREVAVSLKGHPDKEVTVPVNAGPARLRVRPGYWTTDMKINLKGTCLCTCAANQPSGKLLPDGSCLTIKGGAVSMVKPPERVTEKLRCSVNAAECEIQKGSVKQFGTEYSNGTSTEISHTVGVSASVSATGSAIVAEATYTAALSYEFQIAMAKTESKGWSEETLNSTTFVCHIQAGHTGWVEIKPEFYIKEGTVCNEKCSDLSKWFPKTASDGSIAGERYCVAEKTNGTWRRKRGRPAT